MADCVPASICIGGALRRQHLGAFMARIEAVGLVDSLGEYFRADHMTGTEPIELFANDVAWGRFDDLKAFCTKVGRSKAWPRDPVLDVECPDCGARYRHPLPTAE